MSLLISDEIIKKSQFSEKEFLLEMAIWLFASQKISFGRASKLACLPAYTFQQELGKRKIGLHYGISELEEDAKSIGALIGRFA